MTAYRQAPEGVDPSKPNAARIYDYLLGGKDNYEADRFVAQRMLAVAPDTRMLAWFSRQFLIHAVATAAEAGVRQFLDLGAGIPTSPAVHEVAHKTDPAARVVSIDYDPVVYAHANAMLVGTPNVTSLIGDVRDPVDLIHRMRTDRLIDFDQPVAVLCVGVLHYIMDNEYPERIIARFRDVMAPGSSLAFTHGSSDSVEVFINRSVNDTLGSTAQVQYRSVAEIATMFEGFDIVEPGIVPIQQWLGDDLPDTGLILLGGICRIPD
ncbi:SAM-dependent methyltransferase [Nocardia sp. NPDC051570]|uniref:SAM-dependent methyltransferase n=1 Tax=Nocardia sp. NPDC051570 TaxID=3364324 RepID=UPI00379376B7